MPLIMATLLGQLQGSAHTPLRPTSAMFVKYNIFAEENTVQDENMYGAPFTTKSVELYFIHFK